MFKLEYKGLKEKQIDWVMTDWITLKEKEFIYGFEGNLSCSPFDCKDNRVE